MSARHSLTAADHTTQSSAPYASFINERINHVTEFSGKISTVSQDLNNVGEATN